MEGISAGTVFVDVLPNMAGFSSKLAAGMESQGLASRASSLGKSLTRSLTLPIVGLAAVSTKWAIDFQREMEMVHTQAGASQGEVTRLSKSVLDLSKSTMQGPQQLAGALFHIESVGYRGAAAMDVLKTATKGAAVGGADLEETASALAAVTLTNIKGTENYDHAMGVLNATIGAGNMRMGDLLEALKSGIVPTAKVAGLSLSGLTAALAMMTDEGVPAGVAANRLRTSLLMMTNPTVKAQGALKTLGLSSLDLGHALQKPDGLVTALSLLAKHMEKVHDPTKRLALIGDIFGGSRSAGTIALLMNNLDRVKMKYDQINHTAGHFNKDVLATQQTAAFKLGVAWSSVQASLIKVGGALAPFISQLAGAVGRVADAFSGLSANGQKWVLIAAGIAAAIGPLLSIFGFFVSKTMMVGRAIQWLINLGPTFEASMAAQGAAATASSAETVAAIEQEQLALVGLEEAMTSAQLQFDAMAVETVTAADGMAAGVTAAFAEQATAIEASTVAEVASVEAADAAMAEAGVAATLAMGPIGLFAVGVVGIGVAAAGILGFMSGSTGATDALASASDQATRSVDGLNAALNHSKNAHQDAISARHQETSAALAVKSAQDGVNKLVKEGQKGTLAYKEAENQLALAHDHYRTAAASAALATQHWRQEQAKARKETTANKFAMDKFAESIKKQLRPLQTTAAGAKFNGEIQQHNNGVIQSAIKHYGELSTKYAQQAQDLKRSHPLLSQAETDLSMQARATQDLIQKWGDLSHLSPANLRAEIDIIQFTQNRGTAANHGKAGLKGKGRATGGPADAGTPYIVGDGVGPELFVPNVDGHIFKDTRMADRISGGGGGRHRLVITNWEEGTGYFETVSDGSVDSAGALATQRGRMHR